MGIKSTVACQESGAGKQFIQHVKRGSEPSVGKVQLLAQYLGVTVSDLLGEEPAPQEAPAEAAAVEPEPVEPEPTAVEPEPVEPDETDFTDDYDA